MAEKKTGLTPMSDRTQWWTDLNFIPSEDKNELFAAQFIFYMKQNGQQFLADSRWHDYNKLDKGELNEKVYKNMVDPRTPEGSGGTADYFSADFMDYPIDAHLDNILRAKLDKIGIENKLQVNEIDKFAKTQKQKDKDRVLYQHLFREVINEIYQDLGLPTISDSQDPYKYIKSLETDGGKGSGGMDSVDSLLDYIKNQIRDSQDLALYENYVYKGDIERAFEMGIEHYLINLNKWSVKCQRFNRDLKNFNKACGRWTIDETNGRGTVHYMQPNELFTNPFQAYNGEDITFWFNEPVITFAEFVRQFGANLTEVQLKEVFELNKSQGATHGMNWSAAKSVKGSEARIKIGFASMLTQDADNFSVKYVNNEIPTLQRKPLSWKPNKNTPDKYQTEQSKRIYNVWYSFYYIPPPSDRQAKNTQADWAWQSQYIFNLKKDIDMYRYGVDMRYAKSQLVIWKDETRLSYQDIKQAFKPKINNLWHKVQNCFIQDTTALVVTSDLLNSILNSVDEGNKDGKGNGKDAAIESIKQMRQSGFAMIDFRDKMGNIIADPQKSFINIDSQHIKKAQEYMIAIASLYNQMQIALSTNDIAEGQDVKPRTPAAGIQASLAASTNGMWFIEKPAREFLIMFGERVVQHILCMVKERKKYGFKQRWDEFQSVVGMANSLMIEGIEDLNPEEIGITVELEDVQANQRYIFELANKMADDGEVGREVVGLIMNTLKGNWKYAYALLMVEKKRKDREKADQEELQFERQMQQQDKQLQIAQALQQNKDQGKIAQIQAQAQADAMVNEVLNKLKAETQAQGKDQIANNRMRQDENKQRLEEQAAQKEKEQASMPATSQ